MHLFCIMCAQVCGGVGYPSRGSRRRTCLRLVRTQPGAAAADVAPARCVWIESAMHARIRYVGKSQSCMVAPGEHPPLLPAAVENHAVWPDAWKSSTIDKQAGAGCHARLIFTFVLNARFLLRLWRTSEKAAADAETSSTGNESSKNRWVSEAPVDRRTRLSSVAAGVIATRALSAAAREQVRVQLIGHL